jgi:ubiquinone/menaquinone biosynthesis C-methylase UbiE
MSNRVFTPAEAYKLENPERLKWLPPAEVLARLNVTPGMVVADIGAGTGYFALPLARAVAPDGKVYAVDFQPAMLALLAQKLESEGGDNIVLVEGSASKTQLAVSSCDLVLLANMWHELDDAPSVLEEVRRVIRPGGRFAVLDFRPNATRPPGPPPEYRKSAEQVSESVTSHGWKLEASSEVGTYSYLLVFELPLGSESPR